MTHRSESSHLSPVETATHEVLREARKRLSQILTSGETITIARPHEEVRGFIVGVKPHSRYDDKEQRTALTAAKAKFLAAWQQATAR